MKYIIYIVPQYIFLTEVFIILGAICPSPPDVTKSECISSEPNGDPHYYDSLTTYTCIKGYRKNYFSPIGEKKCDPSQKPPWVGEDIICEGSVINCLQTK